MLTKLEISFETFLNAYFFLLESLSGCFCLWAPFMALGRLAGEKELAQAEVNMDKVNVGFEVELHFILLPDGVHHL